MLQLQQHFRDPGDARSTLQVPNVGLHGADRAELPTGVACAEGLRERGYLNRVSQRSSGPMRLHVADHARLDARLRNHIGNDLRLSGRIRHRVPVGLATMIDGGALDHAVDVVLVLNRTRQGFEEHSADTLARHVSVSPVPEARAPSRARGELTLRQRQILVRVDRYVDAAGERELALSVADALAGQMNGREGARAHGVNGKARSLEIAEVRDPVRDRGRAPTESELFSVRLSLRSVELILRVHHANEYAYPRSPRGTCIPSQLLTGVAGVLQRLIRTLQEQTLLRIHELGLAGRDIEEQRVELIDSVHEAAPLAIGLADLALLRVEVPSGVPAPPRNLRDAIPAFLEVAPVLLEVLCLREPSAHTDDRNIDRAGVRGFGARCFTTSLIPCTATRAPSRDSRASRGTIRMAAQRRLSRLVQAACERRPMSLHEVGGEGLDALILEHERLRQSAKGTLELLDHSQRYDRVDPVAIQPGARIDLLGPQLEHAPQALLEEQHRSLQIVATGRGYCRRGAVRKLAAERGLGSDESQQPLAIARKHENLRLAPGPCRGECLKARAGRQRLESQPPHVRHGLLVAAHAPFRPQRPIDRQRAAVPLALPDELVAMAGVAIQEGIACGVVTLPDVAQRAGQGREQQEELEGHSCRRAVEIAYPLHLRHQHLPELRVRFRDDEIVFERSGCVQYAMKRTEPRDDIGDALFDRCSVRHVEGVVAALHFVVAV